MLHRIYTKQILHCDVPTAWEFMSSPKNLAEITPSYMGFHILNPKEELQNMYPGQIIEYHVSPLLGIKLHWVTEITHIAEGKYFVDEQRTGPYAFWHHKHFIQPHPKGVEMIDLVHYALPLGLLGNIANAIYVKKQLKQIFDHRFAVLEKKFNSNT